MDNEKNGKREAVKVVQTAGRDRLGDFAPDFARYNDDILFGEVWSKNDVLSLHDRSIVTVSALVASGIIDSSLKYHIESAIVNSSPHGMERRGTDLGDRLRRTLLGGKVGVCRYGL